MNMDKWKNASDAKRAGEGSHIEITPRPQYFIPSIENIRVGDECIIKAPLYEGKKFIIDEDQVQYAASCIRAGILFIPYLTKEQIENEGWLCHAESDYPGSQEPWWENHLRKGVYSCYLREDIYRVQFTTNIGKRTIYHGPCKDINTFRYICKLLSI